jgi:hypothetical protein
MYNKLSEEFIDAYCDFKRKGFNTQESLIGAKISIQNDLATALHENRLNYKTALAAYKNILNDSNLIEKAIQYYQGMK